MEKINYRFLNYKRYNKFLEDLNNNKVREDAIVFIQDNLRIWARGKEYICNGVSDTELNRGILTFKDGQNNVKFTISITDNSISVQDTDGNTRTINVVSSSEMQSFRSSLQNRLAAIESNSSNLLDKINSKQDRLTFDTEIKEESSNAVENRAIAEEFKNYVKESQLLSALNNKQDNLILGDGLAFRNNQLEITLDREVFVIVDELPQNPSTNKIYMVLQPDGEEMKYFSYKFNGEEWIVLGDQTPKIDLSEYAKIIDSDNKYTTPAYITEQLQNLRELINNTYQKKANYAQIGYLNQRLEDLQRIIDAKYVLKKDVYIPDRNWSSTDIVDMGDHTIIDVESGQGYGGNSGTNMVTLSESKYQWLASLNAINPNTYYFTYEGEETNNNWTFGGTFPIILGEDNMGTFPITLT